MHLLLVISVEDKAAAALVFTGVISPAVGFALKHHVSRCSTYGWGPFAILDQSETTHRRAPAQLDPAMQAAEVRQMLVPKQSDNVVGARLQSISKPRPVA
jgi:hypothetical protein